MVQKIAIFTFLSHALPYHNTSCTGFLPLAGLVAGDPVIVSLFNMIKTLTDNHVHTWVEISLLGNNKSGRAAKAVLPLSHSM